MSSLALASAPLAAPVDDQLQNQLNDLSSCSSWAAKPCCDVPHHQVQYIDVYI